MNPYWLITYTTDNIHYPAPRTEQYGLRHVLAWGVVQIRGVIVGQTMVQFRVVGKDSVISMRAGNMVTVHV